ncbi:SDR family NAD(P)-dependent oxidoreductase [Nocardia sp. SYP-A9097]|uniref:SDR family oxidoreductase n=1 Tax=Nocardia sp. SYP-A9097 TaxID=2663237 RepID=UPI00129B556D|nr:SDR family oxidoreductase [Nocardia sp. SYP-A9097]MRH91228.1 SDR family NAD(P)-dependent oxidoreductase [Nocardia sp. SYP-A9097]
MTSIKDSVALVTGGSRGIGKALVDELFARGASKVYATARDPLTITHPDVIPLALELTDPDAAAALAEQAPDVTILLNNAGTALGSSFLDSPIDDIRREFEINFYGPLYVTRALAPVLQSNGGGHILTIHSALSWFSSPGTDGYGASKAALWSQTNALRLALRPRGITVTGLHVGYVDTDLTAGIDVPKNSPQDVATQALDGIEADALEVLVDDLTRQVKAGLAADPSVLYPHTVASS